MPQGYVKGQPDVGWWVGQIRKGIEFRKKHAREKEWSTWRGYYRGNWRPDTMPSALYFKLLRTIVPRIYFRNPSISIVSTKPGPENLAFAHILQRIDNKLLRSMKVKQQIKKIVQNTFMFGTGIGKLGYGAQFNLIPDIGGTTDPSKNGEIFEYSSLVRDNMPWFMSVHPGNFIVPTGLVNYEDARWSAMWTRRPLADVKSDPRFKNTAQLHGNSTGIIPNMDMHKSGVTHYTDMIDLVEIRDKKMSQAFVLAPYASDRALYQDNDELFINGRHTFYPVVFNDDDDVFWGIPDSVVIDPLQREINEIKTLEMKHRRLSLVKILIRRGGMQEEEAEKLVSEQVAPIIYTEESPDAVLKVIEGLGIPKELFLSEEAVMRDARETVGFSRNQFGEFKEGSSDTTATEARIVQMASDIRVDERRDMVADMLVDMVSDMHHVIFDQWRNEQVIDISGPAEASLWVKFTGAMLKSGSYEVAIDPDSSVPETKGVREQKAGAIYNLFNNDPMIDQMQLRKFLISEMNNPALESLLSPQPQQPGGNPGNPLEVGQLGQLLSRAGAGRGGSNLAAVRS